jgi:hypothetical protein
MKRSQTLTGSFCGEALFGKVACLRKENLTVPR